MRFRFWHGLAKERMATPNLPQAEKIGHKKKPAAIPVKPFNSLAWLSRVWK
jgi:hypothetical protein